MKTLSIESKIVGGFIVALVVLLLAGSQMYRSLTEYIDTSRWVAHSHLVLDALDEVRMNMNEMVGSQRTYIITGDEQYLRKHELMAAEIRAALAQISQLTSDNERQQVRARELARQVEERFTLMASNITLFRAKGEAAARERIINGSANLTMDALMKQYSAMRNEELILLKTRSVKAEHNADQALRVGALLVAATLAGLPLLWWRVRRSARERQANESLVQESQLLKQYSDDLTREDTINKAYGDLLTLINQDWFNVKDMTEAALTQLNGHASILTGVSYLAHGMELEPLSSIGVPLPKTVSGLAQEACKRNEIVTLSTIPLTSILTMVTGVGSIIPKEIIAVPLAVKNQVVAVLELSSLLGFTDTDRRIINRIIPQLGISINQKALEQIVLERSSQLEIANFELVTINEQSRTLNDALLISNEQLQVQKKIIAESNQRLEGVSRSKSDFLANMSHELRTPLNSVIGFSEVLQDQLFGSLNDKQGEYVNNILTSGRHLLSLINDILDLSKVESGRMELDLSEFSLRETIEASLVMLKEKAVKGELTVAMTVAPEADIAITADQRKLKQIMFNLVSNAVKFTPAGGVINISATKSGDFMEIAVSDNGRGIKETDIAKLFHPFTQLESVYTKEFEGTGLGLALTRQLVELHGGMVWVKSVFGSGSCFTFTIPLTQSAVVATDTVETTVIPKEGAAPVGNTVLLVDDDPLTLSSMEKILHSKGYRALRASNGAKAVEMVQNEPPDLIVLDLMMPGMSGFDVAARLKSKTSATNVPILVLTSMDLTARDRARLAGKVWRIEGKGSLSTHEFLNLVESAIAQ
jgi:signal transduction histidine kinase/CHASE3 domain sensor protein/CheY-like chemotaxis protein